VAYRLSSDIGKDLASYFSANKPESATDSTAKKHHARWFGGQNDLKARAVSFAVITQTDFSNSGSNSDNHPICV
jgi:hypothetical protein